MAPLRYFGEYGLGEHIGGGLYTKVYKAHSFHARPTFGHVVAIKTLQLRGNIWERGRLVRQFEREAEIARQLSHPNVVKVHNFGKFHRHFAILMEYVDGKNLKEYLYDREKWPLPEIVRICHEAGKGIEHIHRHEIVHKDVKPDNVLVSRDRQTVKITDFGIAKLPRRFWMADIFPKAGTVTKFATISYVAPEQAAGAAEFRSDIYSFGVALDEVIAAKLAVPDHDGDDYFSRIDVRAHRKNSGRQPIISFDLPIPDGLKEIIRTATSPDPRSRFQTMAALLDALKEYR